MVPGGRVRRRQWYDVGLAAGALAISVSVVATMPSGSPGPVAGLLVVAHVGPVAFRRTAPRAAFVVSTGAAALYLAAGWPMVGLGLAALVMTYSLAAYTARRHALPGLAAVESGLVVEALLGEGRVQPDTLLGNLLVVAAAWILGDGARRRREDALAEQAQLARRAVEEERLRIARELHDVVAHSMSVIAVQAGTGRMVIDDDVEHARRALAAIEETSKRALDEMRRLLGVLRVDTSEGAASRRRRLRRQRLGPLAPRPCAPGAASARPHVAGSPNHESLGGNGRRDELRSRSASDAVTTTSGES